MMEIISPLVSIEVLFLSLFVYSMAQTEFSSAPIDGWSMSLCQNNIRQSIYSVAECKHQMGSVHVTYPTVFHSVGEMHAIECGSSIQRVPVCVCDKEAASVPMMKFYSFIFFTARWPLANKISDFVDITMDTFHAFCH